MAEVERVAMTWEEARDRLAIIPDYDAGAGPEPCVHTILDGSIQIGAHWSLTEIEEAIGKWGCVESGPVAAGRHYGLVIFRPDTGPLFLATVEA